MAVEQQVLVLNAQLGEANAQIALMAAALDTLRQESCNAVRELHRMFAEAKPVDGKAKTVNFVNTKVFEGGKYLGSTKESYKTWAKKVKTYLNSQVRGMRKALELSEEADSKVQIGDLKLDSQQFAAEANEKLYDFLLTFTSEEAFQVVEPFNGDGFEAWRQLKRRYTPTGGATQIDRTMRMMNKKACKSIANLPAAIDLLDRELRRDEEASGHRVPDHTRIALLVRLFTEK